MLVLGETGSGKSLFLKSILSDESGIKKNISINEIPYEKIINNAEKTMMKRYHDEYHHGQFGIYQGNEKKGKVKKVY